jgi:hypothetical protein
MGCAWFHANWKDHRLQSDTLMRRTPPKTGSINVIGAEPGGQTASRAASCSARVSIQASFYSCMSL